MFDGSPLTNALDFCRAALLLSRVLSYEVLRFRFNVALFKNRSNFIFSHGIKRTSDEGKCTVLWHMKDSLSGRVIVVFTQCWYLVSHSNEMMAFIS